MNRKLRNTLAGLYASLALFALGIALAQPGVGLADATAEAIAMDDVAPHAAPAAARASIGTALPVAPAAPRRASRPVRRHTFVMPYFSFAPRG